MDNIKIFYDGTNIDKYAKLECVVGFTTNTSFMKADGKLNYREFMDTHRVSINERPISLQLFSDDYDEAYEQAKQISSLGTNVYVKVPVINSSGAYNKQLITNILEDNININVTAIFTITQVDALYEFIKDVTTTNSKIVVSIFSGRISDTCVNPASIVSHATSKFSSFTNIEVLWAGCKEVLSIQHAVDCKCHIITIPDSILDRLSRINKDLTEFSLETVRSFKKDAIDGNIQII
jgi:transaldolase